MVAGQCDGRSRATTAVGRSTGDLDGQNVTALIGRANQRLLSGTPDIEGAFADIGLAEQVDSTVAEIKFAKALAHAKRATFTGNGWEDRRAEKDLKEAETLGASDSQLTTVRQVLAAAYVKQAEDGVASGDVAASGRRAMPRSDIKPLIQT